MSRGFHGLHAAVLIPLLSSSVAFSEPVEFRFLPADAGIDPSSVRSVHLAGTFNDWSTSATPMEGPGENGAWSLTLDLADGEYKYKFVVNGGDWRADPGNPLRADDAYGNSLLLVGSAKDLAGPASPRDDTIVAAGLEHAIRWPYLDVLPGNMWLVRLRTKHYDLSEADIVIGVENPRQLPMRFAWSEGRFDYWEVLIDTPPEPGAEYAFLPMSGDSWGLYDASGLSDNTLHEAFFWPEAEKLDLPRTPDWSRGIVWYQILPDSFRNGDPANDPKDGHLVPWTWDWWKPTPHENGSFYDYVWDRRFGGDLEGARDKLDYLQDLGIDAIYFNPVFEANSSHKYNTADYRHIDDNFGYRGDQKGLEEGLDPSTWEWTRTDRLFLDFLGECHGRGLRVIIDGVFNHSGTDFWAWQDILKRGKESPYASWYKIESFEPFRYSGWYGFGGLPEYAQNANGLVPGIRDHVFEITRRWMDPDGDGNPADGIDGWRLDVPDLVAAPFWRKWRRVAKGANPDAFISAEIWERATDALRGDRYDAVMNYEFARRAVRFFVDRKDPMSVSEFDWSLHQLLGWYPWNVNLSMQNLYDSHDTDRVVSMIINPDRRYDEGNRPQDGAPYDVSKPPPRAYERLKLMVTFQMTFVGSPMIWYGDEAGMWGPDDPTCREPMIWRDLEPYDNPQKQFEEGLFDHYRTMIAIRRSLPALRLGAFETVLADDDRRVYAFRRRLGRDLGNSVIVVLNASGRSLEVDVPVPETGRAWLNLLAPEGRLVLSGRPPEIDWEASEIPEVKPSEDGKGVRVFLAPDASAVLVAKLAP